MPYIKQEERTIDTDVWPRTAGQLNYVITQAVSRYVSRGLNYQAINDALGALEGAKLELYRRVASGYEDKKIVENGDVYPSEIL